MSALAMLRDVLGLTGTKYACGEGECGACTIMVDGVSVCACLMFAADCEDRELTTIEGLARDPLGQKIEQAFVDCGAVQCGFCTPGLIMAAHALLERTAQPTGSEIREELSGNICRCTGYGRIIEAVQRVAVWRAIGP
jgi:aerobic carbon-monoxide dehydrogenase small subunit